MNAPRLAVFVLLMALLSGCVTPLLGPECMRFSRGSQFCLLPPSSLPAVEGSHLVKVTHDGREDEFMGLLHIDAKDLRLAGFSLFGTSLFNLQYDGSTVKTEPAQGALKPDILVAILELAIADPKLLPDRLHGLTLQVKDAGGVESRELGEGDRVLVRIERRGASLTEAAIRIQVPSRNITVEVTPMDSPAAEP